MPVLADPLHCTGCAACRSVCPRECISLSEDAEGFLHPVISRTMCVECDLCERACPVLHPLPLSVPQRVYAAWSNDETVRTRSSSGGLFFELGMEVISRGGVVCGAVLDEKGVHHFCTDSLAGLEVMRGSKYVQSDLGDVYTEVGTYLKEGRSVLFSGTPCQVAALRAVLMKADTALLYTIDLVCHGVPSPALFRHYMDGLRLKYGDFRVSDFRFRSTCDWIFQSWIGMEPIPDRDDAFLQMYLGGVLHRESCYHCPFARRERVGDLTLGDFWGIGRESAFDGNPGRGCSLVLVNNEKGRLLWSALEPRLFSRERSLAEACKQNENLSAPSSRPRVREGIYTRIFRDGLRSEYQRFRFRRFCKETYVFLHHQLHLLKVSVCRKSV